MAQVLPDFVGFLPASWADTTSYTDSATLEDWSELLRAKEMVDSCIRRFLDLEDGTRAAQPKRHRRSTFWLLKALDHALTLVNGRGLEAWVQKPGVLRLLEEPAQEVVKPKEGEEVWSTMPNDFA